MIKILIPVDFSNNSDNAIHYALEFFKYSKSEFYFMHAYQDDIYSEENLLTRGTLDEVTRKIKKESKKRLEDLLKKVKETTPNPRYKYNIIALNSMLVDAADSLVEKENIDVIVMGTRGKTNDRKLSFGSNTLQVLKYVPCPVLAIPENYKYIQPKRVLFPTNYLIAYKRRELKLLCEMVAPYRSKIDMLYVSKSNKLSLRQEDNRTFVKETLCKNDLGFHIVNKKNVTQAVNSYIKESKIDMLVMVNTRHSHLENILFHSTIDEIGLNITIPLLALQNIERII